jgi:hypothetical protein
METANIQRIEHLLEALRLPSEGIGRILELVKRYEGLISSKESSKEWVALQFGFALWRKISEGRELHTIPQDREHINGLDQEFGKRLEPCFPKHREHHREFADLVGALQQGDRYALSFVKMHIAELLDRARHMREPKVRDVMTRLLVRVSRHEVEVLSQYRSTINTLWMTRYRQQPPQFFMGLVMQMLQGTGAGQQRMPGIKTDFSDDKLATAILDNPKIKNLLTYTRQMQFLDSLKQDVEKEMASTEWKGFLGKGGFVDNVKKGRYSDTLLQFGNEKLAEEITQVEKEVHEDPSSWIRALTNWRQRYNVQDIVFNQVVVPAAQELSGLLQRRIEELVAEEPRAFAKLKEEFGAKGVEGAQVEKMRKLLEKRNAELEQKSSSAVTEFRKKFLTQLEQAEKFQEEFERIVTPMQPDYILKRSGKLEESGNKQSAVARQLVVAQAYVSMRAMVRALGAIEGISAKREEAQKFRDLGHVTAQELSQLTELVQRAKTVEAALREVEVYINTELRTKFSIQHLQGGRLPGSNQVVPPEIAAIMNAQRAQQQTRERMPITQR